jgi:hypothetical protein
MNKKMTKKVSLHRESLRRLDPGVLRNAAGGRLTLMTCGIPCSAQCTNLCTSTCPP